MGIKPAQRIAALVLHISGSKAIVKNIFLKIARVCVSGVCVCVCVCVKSPSQEYQIVCVPAEIPDS